MNRQLLEFSVKIYGNIERYNDVLSKARCAVFYKYGNRNGSWITDEFADELISTMHYVPVKGIYEGDDYTDHGGARSSGRVYGIVPETNNFAWETHLDDDGVERLYACTDVLLFTALYQEASEIVGKGQSMELYAPSLKYHQEIKDGIPYAVFDHGCFLGLQVLGDKTEPCFQGASFFTLQDSIEKAITQIKEYSYLGGESQMHDIHFKLSDEAKYQKLWNALNTECDEEHGWICSYAISEVFDNYALAFNFEANQYERVYYTKNDETDEVIVNDHIKVYIIDVTETEKVTLDALRKLNGDTYELVNENLTNAEENAEKCEEFSTKIEELSSQISTLNTEAGQSAQALADANAAYAALEAEKNALETEKATLESYKHSIETQQKIAVIEQYKAKLSEDLLNSYNEQLDSYTAEELDMHLAYELKKSNSGMFAQSQEPNLIFKDTPLTGVEEIISRYKR